jgi:formamidopyrimidine-DNA glycosylase
MLADLTADMTWVTHLGMSGRISLARRGDPIVPHTNVIVRVGGGVEMRLVDPRTFGFVVAYTPQEYAESPLARLGPDALTDLPDRTGLASRLAGRSAPIKALLLDQGVMAGLGNIYADESLWRAGVAPQRPGGSLTADELRKLRKGIMTTLAAGLRWGGTSLDDLAYLLPDGRAGEFASRLRVYGRTDEPCSRCGTPIRQTTIRQRSTHWCAACQV